MSRVSLSDRIRPEKSAVVVIDIQNDFTNLAGTTSKHIISSYSSDNLVLDQQASPMTPMIDSVKKLVTLARSKKVPVIWVKMELNEVTDSRFWKAEGWVFCRQGTWGAEWHKGLGPGEGELEIVKTRHSAFYATNMESILRSLGADGVLLAGIATHGCIEAAARGAMARDFWAVVVGDCCAQLNMLDHEPALKRIDRLFGMATTLEDVTVAWDENYIANTGINKDFRKG